MTKTVVAMRRGFTWGSTFVCAILPLLVQLQTTKATPHYNMSLNGDQQTYSAHTCASHASSVAAMSFQGIVSIDLRVLEQPCNSSSTGADAWPANSSSVVSLSVVTPCTSLDSLLSLAKETRMLVVGVDDLDSACSLNSTALFFEVHSSNRLRSFLSSVNNKVCLLQHANGADRLIQMCAGMAVLV
eukprot:m.85001 g.85001  ORF g.85001 m.85001 type:complete len:186 (-) comp12767_c1_seq5:139-696(-)